jgi:hypothetical protein
VTSKRDQVVGKRMKEIRDLLRVFGLLLHGYDPGITCYRADSKGGLLDFGRDEWEVLEPLLIELRDLRNMAASMEMKRWR